MKIRVMDPKTSVKLLDSGWLRKQPLLQLTGNVWNTRWAAIVAEISDVGVKVASALFFLFLPLHPMCTTAECISQCVFSRLFICITIKEEQVPTTPVRVCLLSPASKVSTHTTGTFGHLTLLRLQAILLIIYLAIAFPIWCSRWLRWLCANYSWPHTLPSSLQEKKKFSVLDYKEHGKRIPLRQVILGGLDGIVALMSIVCLA